MYTNKEDKNILIMVLVIFTVSIIALIAIGNIIWRIISPGVAIVVTEVSNFVKINRLDYNFEIPEKREPVAVEPVDKSTLELTPEEQAVFNRNLDYDFEIPSYDESKIVLGVTNFFEEIYTDYEFGPERITEDSNKNIVVSIPRLSINSPVYITSKDSVALKFGFWMHKSSYKINEGEMVFLCTRRFFDNTDPRSCYYMDYLAANDSISLEFNGETYNYKVDKVERFNQNFDQIYNNIGSDKNKLKIVTTGAVDSGRGRLVVSATRI